MSRIDLLRLRKRIGMSQRDLAGMLRVRPSFLSAIENGRSRLPEEKLEKLKDIFEIDDFSDYMIEDQDSTHVPPHSHIGDQSDSLTTLLNHIHDLAHRRNGSMGGESEETAARIDYLIGRNDRLSEKVDNLRDEVDRLREENLRLKELLIKNNIPY